jgi:hypothetical protein
MRREVARLQVQAMAALQERQVGMTAKLVIRHGMWWVAPVVAPVPLVLACRLARDCMRVVTRAALQELARAAVVQALAAQVVQAAVQLALRVADVAREAAVLPLAWRALAMMAV